jgi:hypothetical protein
MRCDGKFEYYYTFYEDDGELCPLLPILSSLLEEDDGELIEGEPQHHGPVYEGRALAHVEGVEAGHLDMRHIRD